MKYIYPIVFLILGILVGIGFYKELISEGEALTSLILCLIGVSNTEKY